MLCESAIITEKTHVSNNHNYINLRVYLVLSRSVHTVRQRLRFLPPATKLGQGYILTGVCDSVPMGVCLLPGVCSGGGFCSHGGWSALGGAGGDPPGTATAAGGTHPTGTHSCLSLQLDSIITNGVVHTVRQWQRLR